MNLYIKNNFQSYLNGESKHEENESYEEVTARENVVIDPIYNTYSCLDSFESKFMDESVVLDVFSKGILKDMEKEILISKYGLFGKPKLSTKEIARCYSSTVYCINVIHNMSIQKIRKYLLEEENHKIIKRI